MSLATILVAVAVLLGFAGLAVFIGRSSAGRVIVYGGSLVACSVALVAAGSHLLSAAEAATVTLPLGLPWLGAHFRIDALSAFFLVVIELGGAAASLYALGYGRHETAPERVLPFYPAFLAGMTLVLLADDAFSFLFCWEFMSLCSWALVMAHHHSRANLHAGYLYLVMAAFGGFALLLAFGLLAGPDGGYAFAAIRNSHPSPTVTALVFALTLIGAGSKAGLVPLHAWLPLAHPAAPSQVSALLSGVMTKVAIYAFVRIVFEFLGPPVWWWSVLVLALGGITAVLGVCYALMQRDLKRILAYSTIENIGIIFIGLGLALAFKSYGFNGAAALAVTAALLHAFNHSLFKSLLFFGAGAVQGATGERDLEHLGGLIHRMPLTAFTFLIGCVAIAALPPLNGFVSEWLTFQAILLSPELPPWSLKFLVPAVGALLALSAALAAACFVRAFGMGFLGRPRTLAAERAKEPERWVIAGMMLLAALCVVAGILPGIFIDALAPTTKLLIGQSMPVQSGEPYLSIVPIAASRSSYDGLLVLLFMVFSTTAAAVMIHRLASAKLRRGPAWDCGYPDPSPATQYTASSFAQPIRRVFGTSLFRARERVEMPPPGDMKPARFKVEISDPIWDALYAPIADAVAAVAERLNVLQFLSIRHYLSFVFAALVGLLLVLAIWS